MPASKLTICLNAAAVVAALCALPADAGDAAAGKTKIAQCQACHGVDGVSKMPDAPNLAGQNEMYLVKALHDFKSGARKNEIMSMMAANLSDNDIADIAAYYSGIEVTVKGR